jgi:single-stranded-DNA-specific exonuclease
VKQIKWVFPVEVQDDLALIEAAGGNELLARLLIRRGLNDPQVMRAFINPGVYQPASPYELRDMARAVDRLEKAVQTGEQIAVWGDFDVDGQTATTLLVEGLLELGAQVQYYIPHRQRESHGVHLQGLQRLLEKGAQLVLTCDTGISALEAAAYARQQGVDFLVTDHHDLPSDLPQAYTLVNPKFLPEDHPLRTLPGVGVAYKLIEALLERFEKSAAGDRLLDLVALGIVADVAQQTGDTRYLLQRGLQVLRTTRRLGLLNIYELAELDASHLNEEHIAFAIGPRLNALGRLDDANQAVELLTTRDAGRARLLASHLEGLNAQRKLLTDQVFQGVLAQAERDPALLDSSVLVFAHPSWPSGVIGIVASRLVERFFKPVILFSTPPDEPARGSARSIPGIDITAAIATQSQMLYRFGGHPMAAGLSLDAGQIGEFRRAVSRTVSQMLAGVQLEETLTLDARLPLSELTSELVAGLEPLAPFGAGNPALVFASQPLVVQASTPIGRSGEHLQVQVQDEAGEIYRVLWWQGAGWELPQGRFLLAYSARNSNYQARPGLQIEWVDAQPLEESEIRIRDQAVYQVEDYRTAVDPIVTLGELDLPTDTQIWAEGLSSGPAAALSRRQLEPGTDLAIYTSPPGPAELRGAISVVSPQRLILFAVDPELDSPEIFLRRLVGLVKYTLRVHQGKAELSALGAVLSHRSATILAGLEWLQARGQIHLDQVTEETVHLAQADAPQGDIHLAAERLHALLDETRAYRAYYRQADAETFMDL